MTKFLISQGGIGDALLSLAASFKHEKCRIVHATAQTGVDRLIGRMFGVFEVPVYDVLPRPFTIEEYCILRYSRNCVTASYLPDDLDFSDWADFSKYKNRVCTTLPVQDLFGKKPNPCDTHRVVTIAPSGSNHPKTIVAPWGDVTKERLLTVEEYRAVVQKCLEWCTVYVVGSPKDREKYGVVEHPHFFWLTFDDVTCGDGTSRQSDMRELFSLVNSSDLVISADTWLKTYTCMANLPTVVVKTRYDGQYLDYREVHDWGENIFLNPDLWNITIVKADELVQTDIIRQRLGLGTQKKRPRYF